jgi:Arc/MetJ-type ribon-helix-helix transcriptional regulator
MEVHLTPDQEAFVRQAIESGRLRHEEDAVKEALALWERRERTRAEFLATLDEAEACLARGEGRVITQESMRELAEEVKRRGRARLAAEHTPAAGRGSKTQDPKAMRGNIPMSQADFKSI